MTKCAIGSEWLVFRRVIRLLRSLSLVIGYSLLDIGYSIQKML